MEDKTLNFEDIIGHDFVKRQIEKSINSGKFFHAHIICGEDGIGKSIIARTAAQTLLNKKEDKDYADIIEYRGIKGKKSIGVNEIRMLTEEINKKPVEGDKKIIIVYNAQNITADGQNAFLKNIEEPPPGVFIILLCDNLKGILDTIKSRCQIHKLNRLSEDEMCLFLKKYCKQLSNEQLKPVLAFSDGIPGRAQRFIDDDSLREIRDFTQTILSNLSDKRKDGVLKYESFLMQYKDEWQEVFTCFLTYIRDAMVYKETGKEELIINIDKYNFIQKISETFSYNKLGSIIEIIKDCRQKLNSNVNNALVFDYMLLKMQEV